MKNLFTTFAALLMAAITTNAQTWNFKTYSDADATNLNADEDWKYDSSNDRWEPTTRTFENEVLTANGIELEYTKGLLVTTTVANGIRVGSKRLAMNNTETKITITGLKAGNSVKVSYANSGSTSRALYMSNVNVESGTIATKVNKGTNYDALCIVKEDGDVTLTCTDGAMYIYTLSVSDDSGDGNLDNGDNSSSSNDNSVGLNTSVNQMRLILNNNTAKYYNTADINAVTIKGNEVSVTQNAGTDNFNTVSNLYFKKVEKNDESIEINNSEDKIKILEAHGWQEMAYIRWDLYTGAKGYNVYVKGGQYADYTRIDYQLVRNYGTYGRADIVGLMSNASYSIKVVAVGNDDKEIESSANEASNINVVAYDRRGYAHFGDYGTGVGAYNDNGTLKKGAKVIYLTNDNFNTVTCDINQDGNGAKTLTGIGLILQAKQKGNDDTPLAVRIIGTIYSSNADDVQRLSDQNGLLLKGNKATTVMNVTIEGIGDDAMFHGFGMGVVNGTSIELRNFATMYQGSSDDGLEIKGANHIWIHNMDLFYGKKGSGDHVKGDGALDAKDDCTYATFSYNHFWDTGKSNLCGMKSEHTTNLLTYHHNWYDHSDSRHPRVRTSTVHVWNNYYDGVSKYGIGATTGSSIYSECNYFRDTNYPMLSSGQGRDAEGDGTFSGENGGIIKSYGNVFAEKSNNFACYDQNTPSRKTNDIDCYTVNDPSETVPSSVTAIRGGTQYSNFDTNSATMFEHVADNAIDVPEIVMGWYGAGRLNHGDIQFTFDNALDDHDYGRNAKLEAVLDSYKSKFKGSFGIANTGTGTDEGGNGDSGDSGNGGDGDGDGGNSGDSGNSGEGGNGGGTEPATGTTLCTFASTTPSSDMVTFSGNAKSGSSAKYNGVTYTDGVKMETDTKLTITPTADATITLVFDTASKKVKINGNSVTTDANGQVTFDATKDTTYIITKGDSINLYLIVIKNKE